MTKSTVFISTDDIPLATLAEGVRAADRALLARAITLVESRKPAHQARAAELLQALVPDMGRSIRVGITGVPGVGKSTTIDQLGTNLTAAGHRVAVLAVDPTSRRTGGSILGDKTRMQRLAIDPRAFVRPSPTAGRLGGVARKTREAMALLEAAGFDAVLVETVGVGQSETTVADMVDTFMVLMLPGAGDELQGIKKGILEIADLIVVNKADGDNRARATAAAADYRSALQILGTGGWTPPVLLASGRDNLGLDAVWQAVLDHRAHMTASGAFAARRQDQAVRWLHGLVEDGLREAVLGKPDIQQTLHDLESRVRQGLLFPTAAASAILAKAGIAQ